MKRRMLAKAACLVLTGALVVSGLGSPLHVYGEDGDGSVTNEGGVMGFADVTDIVSVPDFVSAVAELRSGMVAREPKISFRIPTAVIEGTASAYADRIMGEALAWSEEDDYGKEGDYLKWSRAGYTPACTDLDGEILFDYAVTYRTTAAQEEELDKKISEIMATLNLSGKSDYEKAKAIYDWVCANVKEADSAYADRYSAYGAAVGGKAACQGYMTLFYRLCYEAGIKSRCVENAAKNHGWNLVYLSESKSRAGGAWYNVDCTQGAQSAEANRGTYFLKSDTDMLANGSKYERANEYKTLPSCDASYLSAGSGWNLDIQWNVYSQNQYGQSIEVTASRGGRLDELGNPDAMFFARNDKSTNKKAYVFIQSTCSYSKSLYADICANIAKFSGIDIYIVSTKTTDDDIRAFKANVRNPDPRIKFMYSGQYLQDDWLNYTLQPAGKRINGNTPITFYLDGAGKMQYTSFRDNGASAQALLANFAAYGTGDSSGDVPTPATYQITYVMDDGTNHAWNPATYSSGCTQRLEAATKDGYAFKGWYEDAGFKTKITSLSGKNSDLTLYALWEKLQTITYVLNGGQNNAKNPTSYMKGPNEFKLLDPTREGYVFAGWYKDQALTDKLADNKLVTTATTGDVTLYAKWNQILTITYELDGGTDHTGNPTTYETGADFELKAPVKVDYTFAGWYTDKELTKAIKNLKELQETATAQVTLYAKWTPNTKDPTGFPKIDITLTEGNILMGVEGTYLTETKEKILDRLNAIRKEACDEGVVDAYSGKKLTSADYVPLKWSSDLEAIARLRAAESTIRMYHTRPNGKDCFTVKTTNNGFSNAENLAWNGGGIMAGIESWYKEKETWVKTGVNDNDTGHYLNLINPQFKYVAVGAFRLPDSYQYQYPLAIAQQFSMLSTMDSQKSESAGYSEQDMEVAASAVTGLSLGTQQTIRLKAGETQKLVLNATVKFDNAEVKIPRIYTGPVLKGGEWKSFDTEVATVTADGTITAVKDGTTTITATVGNVPAQVIVEVGEPIQPSIKGEDGKTGWDAIMDRAEQGSDVKVDMKGSVEVPAKVFEALKGKDVTVTFDMGNVSWSVNGQNITSDNISDIDLSVKTGTNAIPENMVQELAGNDYNLQLSLAHEGKFGFTAELSINLGKERAGLTAKLHYYNKVTGKLEPISKAKIEQDGTAKLAFTHASDYVIVASEDSGTVNPPTGDPGDPGNKPGDETGNKPGDDTGNKPGNDTENKPGNVPGNKPDNGGTPFKPAIADKNSAKTKAPLTADPWSPWWIALAGSMLSVASIMARRTARKNKER